MTSDSVILSRSPERSEGAAKNLGLCKRNPSLHRVTVCTQNMSAEAAPCEASPWDMPPFCRAWEPGLLLPDNVCVHTGDIGTCVLCSS